MSASSRTFAASVIDVPGRTVTTSALMSSCTNMSSSSNR